MKNVLLIALLLISGATYAQNVGIGTSNPDESAILDLQTTNKGFLLPRLTEKQKDLIPTPAEGLMIYQTDTNKQGVYLYQSGSWKNIGSGNITTSGTTANAVTSYTSNYLLTGNGTATPVSSSVFVNPTNGNVGIGNTAPRTEKLQVNGNVIMTNRNNAMFVISQNNSLRSNYVSQFVLTNGSTFYGANDRSWQVANVGLDATSASLDFQYWNGSTYLLPFRILPSGRTLIGGPVPSDDGISALQVNGSVKQSSVVSAMLKADAKGRLVAATAGTDYLVPGSAAFVQGTGTVNYLSKFSAPGTVATTVVAEASSNIGIGTATPTQKLDVVGSIQQSAVKSSLVKTDGTGKLVAATAGTDFVAAGTNSVGTIAKFSAAGTVANSAITEAAVSNGAGVKVDSKSAGYLAVGDFGAGTPMSIPAGYRLVVQDGIITEKVKVAIRNQTDWADYVFEPTYALMPLSEVEKFVKENKHLPNVPSADEMVKKGVEVGQTSKMFMEKIEELTLYMIEMKKEIEALKAENAKLKK
jgi:hypothetical protein